MINMKYHLHYVFYEFWHIFSPELFRVFRPRTVPFASHSKVFVKLMHQTCSAIRFWKFSNSCTKTSGTPVSWKIQDFLFWLGFNASKKLSGYFTIVEYIIARYISSCIFRIYIVLYGYKLLLTSYVGLKIRKSVKFLDFLHLFHF